MGMGLFGLRTKREILRVGATLAHVRKAAREPLKLDEKDNRRIFEGSALLRRMVRLGVLEEGKAMLDYVLALKVDDFLERRLQTQVFKLGLAKSIHHARVVIRQRHIRVGRQIVNVPSFMVRLDSQKHIDHSLHRRSVVDVRAVSRGGPWLPRPTRPMPARMTTNRSAEALVIRTAHSDW